MLGLDHGRAFLPSIFRRAVFEERRALIGWGVGLATTVFLQLSMYPTIKSSDMTKLVDSYPEPLKQVFNMEDFTTGVGYVRTELFSFTIPLLMVILGVLWGSDAIAGEEERRTIDLVLAHPISRGRMLLEKAAAVAAGVGLLGLLILAVLVVGDVAFGMGIGLGPLAAVMAATVLLTILYAAIALAIGAATGHRGSARGATAALAVAAYLLSTLAPLVDWLRPWRVLSPWYHALGVDPLGTSASPGRLLLLLVAIGIALAIGVKMFDRRDLAT